MGPFDECSGSRIIELALNTLPTFRERGIRLTFGLLAIL